MDHDWIRELRDMCVANKTAFYYKQDSGILPSRKPPELDGRTWEEYPKIWSPEHEILPKETT